MSWTVLWDLLIMKSDVYWNLFLTPPLTADVSCRVAAPQQPLLCILCCDCVLMPRNRSRSLDFLTWCLAVKYLEPFMKCIMSPISRKHAILFDFSEYHSHMRKKSCLFWFCVAESVTPTVELNALCMRLGKKPMYKPVDPYSRMQSTYNYNMRGGAYPPRYVPVLG